MNPPDETMGRPDSNFKTRCAWFGISDPLYTAYHDTEWGVPQTDDRILFEKMTLEAFQSGLSWLTILKKRENFRKAFHNFDTARIARYKAKDVERLLNDPGIVRHRLKIDATINNARAFEALSKHTRFSTFLWSFVDGQPIINHAQKMSDVSSQTDVSRRMAKALKGEGFRFVGPTTMYALMQAMGMVNDHLVDCHRHAPCTELQTAFKAP
ncbi:MAG: DNA-3-methyladenine glycosylase I [Hyphomicrobiaceae bacterium]